MIVQEHDNTPVEKRLPLGWRPKDWEQPELCSYWDRENLLDAFEMGADAMFKALQDEDKSVVPNPLTKKQEQMLWNIKLLAYDFYGSTFTTESLRFAEAIRKQVDAILRAEGNDPVVHMNCSKEDR